jgi:pilus assembly protein Flp/PilA
MYDKTLIAWCGQPIGKVPVCVSLEPNAAGTFVDTGIFRKENLMRQITEAVVNFVKREDGPTAVEYAVMLALIIVVCLAAISALGQNANATFTTVGGKIGSASS